MPNSVVVLSSLVGEDRAHGLLKRRNLFAVTLTNLANLYVPRAARNGLLQGIRRWMVKRQIELAGPLTLFIAGLVRIKGVG
jgi:hypothetical protein